MIILPLIYMHAKLCSCVPMHIWLHMHVHADLCMCAFTGLYVCAYTVDFCTSSATLGFIYLHAYAEVCRCDSKIYTFA